MEGLISLLDSYLSNDVTLRWTVVVVVALIIFVFAIGLSVIFLGVTNPIRHRLGLIDEAEDRKRGTMALKISTAIGPVAAFILPKEDLERDKVKRDLYRAGFHSPQALQVYYASKAVLAIALAVTTLLAARFMPDVTSQKLMFYVTAAAGVGMLIPGVFLSRALDKRLRLLRNGFPDALDLLVVCVEAGLGLGPALQRVADEINVSHPELSRELATVNAEMRAGVPREKALKNLSERTGLPDIRGLVALLVQSMKFGTSVADALRIYSEEFRDKRMQAAEEQAAKIGTKMIFPLVLFMFPVFFVVAVGPAALRIIDAFARL